MRAFLMIHLSDKMTDAGPRFVNALIVVEMNFFLLEGADESFGNLSVLPRTVSSVSYRNLNIVRFEQREIRI